jgi:hypothetical protein
MDRIPGYPERYLPRSGGGMMPAYDPLKAYMSEIEGSLSGLDRKRKVEILAEIRDDIDEKVEFFRSDKKGGGSVSDRDMEKILDDFGDPDEVALNYKMHSPEGYKKRSISIPWPQLLGAFVLIIFLIGTITAAVLIVSLYREDQDGSIHMGEGIDDIKLTDGYDEISLIFGEPEDREDTDTTVWLSYREEYGLDFLLSKDMEEILEIRINDGYEGKTDEGIGIGDDLDDVFLKISEPLLSVDANWSDTHRNSEGGDRVLYNQMEGGGNILAFKYIDEKKGVLIWADSDRKITQIVVFRPYNENTVDVLNLECTISSDTDIVTMDIVVGKLTWNQLDVMVDGKVFDTKSLSTSGGSTASFIDPDGEFDAESGESYVVKVIFVSKSQVVWEMEIIAN